MQYTTNLKNVYFHLLGDCFFEKILICFEEEVWMLTSRFSFSFAFMVFFRCNVFKFFFFLAFRRHSFMKFSKSKEGEGAGSTKFWTILLMVVRVF